MKYYRLSEVHTRYGMTGRIIDQHIHAVLVYHDRPLFELIDEQGTGYPYRLELTRDGQKPSLYFMQDAGEVHRLVEGVVATLKMMGATSPQIPLKTNARIRIANQYTLNITYRSQWDNDTSTY